MNVLQGLAAGVTLEELARVSYAPLADVVPRHRPARARHTELGLDRPRRRSPRPRTAAPRAGRHRLLAAHASPTASAPLSSARFETLKRFGLRHRPNEALLADWTAAVRATLAPLGLA